ncbi:MAG: FYDLN acid domain-containing protein [Myxococcota bacterium]
MKPDKAKLGTRYTCFKCGVKFYDLNRPESLCPDCGADQAEAPIKDVRTMLLARRRAAKAAKAAEAALAESAAPSDDEDDEFDDLDDDSVLNDDEDDEL